MVDVAIKNAILGKIKDKLPRALHRYFESPKGEGRALKENDLHLVASGLRRGGARGLFEVNVRTRQWQQVARSSYRWSDRLELGAMCVRHKVFTFNTKIALVKHIHSHSFLLVDTLPLAGQRSSNVLCDTCKCSVSPLRSSRFMKNRILYVCHVQWNAYPPFTAKVFFLTYILNNSEQLVKVKVHKK